MANSSRETLTMNKDVDRVADFSWWLDSHNRPHHSHWLQATLSDLDVKTQLILDVIQEDGDSFAKRAEMFYKRKPELIAKLEDFYKSYRSLAEDYDHLKFELINAAQLRSLSTLDSIEAQTIQKCEREISAYLKHKEPFETETQCSSDDANYHDYMPRKLDDKLALALISRSCSSDGNKGYFSGSSSEKGNGDIDEIVLGRLEKVKKMEERKSELIDEQVQQQEKMLLSIKDKSEMVKMLKEENRALKAQLARARHMNMNMNKQVPIRLSKSKLGRPSFIGRLTGCTRSP